MKKKILFLLIILISYVSFGETFEMLGHTTNEIPVRIHINVIPIVPIKKPFGFSITTSCGESIGTNYCSDTFFEPKEGLSVYSSTVYHTINCRFFGRPNVVDDDFTIMHPEVYEALMRMGPNPFATIIVTPISEVFTDFLGEEITYNILCDVSLFDSAHWKLAAINNPPDLVLQFYQTNKY